MKISREGNIGRLQLSPKASAQLKRDTKRTPKQAEQAGVDVEAEKAKKAAARAAAEQDRVEKRKAKKEAQLALKRERVDRLQAAYESDAALQEAISNHRAQIKEIPSRQDLERLQTVTRDRQREADQLREQLVVLQDKMQKASNAHRQAEIFEDAARRVAETTTTVIRNGKQQIQTALDESVDRWNDLHKKVKKAKQTRVSKDIKKSALLILKED